MNYKHAGWTECPLRGLCENYNGEHCITICGVHRIRERFKRYWLGAMVDCFKGARD